MLVITSDEPAPQPRSDERLPIATYIYDGKGYSTPSLFGGLSNELAKVDPITVVSKELAQLDKDLSLSENAPLLAAIAVSVAMPGVGSAIGQQMMAAGLLPATTSAAVASAIGTGVANAALQVAQGKSPEDALKGAVVGGVAGFAGGQVGDYLVGDPGAVKNFVSSTAANMVAGKDPETAAKTALIQTGIQGTADLISTAQAEKYLENLPIPDYLAAGPAPTSADTIAAYPELAPQTYAPNFEGPLRPGDIIDSTLSNLTSDQIDAALSNLTGGYTLGGTKEGITATLPETIVTGTEPIDYTLQAVTGGTGIQAQPDILATTNLAQTSTGLQTYTYDDGSTITVDANGDVVGYTEATETPYTGPVEPPSSPLTKSQVEGLIKLGLGIYGASQVSDVVRDAIASGDDTTQGGFPFTPSDISGWASPTYTQTFKGPIDLNSLFTTDNLLGGTQWAGLQGNQFANIPQVSMSDFISSIQNGKV